MDAATITAIAVVIVAATGAFTAWNNRKIKAIVTDTHAQVVTLNESPMGQLAAETETRRVEEIPHDQRTEKEQRHLDAAPPDAPPQGPPRMADRLAHVDERVEQVHHAVNGDDDDPPKPSLYELVQGLCERFDGMAERVDALEVAIGLPRGGR